jgi:NTP pyrophosphatase (non-canonical NTP hydrolase)
VIALEFEQYQKEMKRTASDLSYKAENLALGAMGIAGEAGEVADYIKKIIFHKHEMSTEKLALELGDVLWYISYLASVIGYDLDQIAEMNIEKLRKRYPKGWDAEKSINRIDE